MIKKISLIALVVVLLAAFLNIPVTTRQGIDFEVKKIRIPLYIKVIEFIDRDYQYKRIVRDIIRNKPTDRAKILAIFNWVTKNISGDIPHEWAIYDDHVLNIIIRRYGTPDQIQDVLATLASYAGYPSIVYKAMPKDSDSKLYITLINLGEQWLVLDPYFKNYFIDDRNEVATVEYINSNYPCLSPVNSEVSNIKYKGVKYVDYFGNINIEVDFRDTKAKRQMVGSRIIYELKKLL